MIARRFGSDPRVRYVSMRDFVDTSDPSKSFDLMHLNAEGNRARRAAARRRGPGFQAAAPDTDDGT